jgi:hypothetical protein
VWLQQHDPRFPGRLVDRDVSDRVYERLVGGDRFDICPFRRELRFVDGVDITGSL